VVEGRRGFGGGLWREGASGGIPGGKPVAVVRMNSASAMSSCWSDQLGPQGPSLRPLGGGGISDGQTRGRIGWHVRRSEGLRSITGRSCRHQDCPMRGEP